MPDAPRIELRNGRIMRGDPISAAWKMDRALWMALQATIDVFDAIPESDAKKRLGQSLARAATYLLEDGWREPNDEAHRAALLEFASRHV